MTYLACVVAQWGNGDPAAPLHHADFKVESHNMTYKDVTRIRVQIQDTLMRTFKTSIRPMVTFTNIILLD